MLRDTVVQFAKTFFVGPAKSVRLILQFNVGSTELQASSLLVLHKSGFVTKEHRVRGDRIEYVLEKTATGFDVDKLLDQLDPTLSVAGATVVEPTLKIVLAEAIPEEPC